MTQPEASRIAAALVSMQAAWLLPGSTRSAAEPTTGTTAAAASAATAEDARVCVGGLGPCPRCYGLLLKATSERTSGLRLLVCTSCAHLLRAPTCSEELVTCMGF